MGQKIGSMYYDVEAKTDKLKDGLKGSKAAVKDFGTEFKSSFTEMKSKIDTAKFAIDTFAGTFKEVFALGKAGAEVTQTAESFAYLTEKVGAVPDLLERLKSAAKGTISELDLMQSTQLLLAGMTGEMATEFANATPRLMEIAKAANKLNPALGDTAFLYDSISKGIKRGQPLILDNLGIVVKVGEANEKYAKSLGKTVEQLTAEEQQMALLNATMEAGGNLIDQVGGNTDSATDAYLQMDAALKDLADTYKSKLAPAISEAARAVTIMATAQDKITDASKEHVDNIIYTTDSYEDYKEEVERLIKLLGVGAWTTDVLSEAEYNLARETKVLATETDRWQAQVDAHVGSLLKQEDAIIAVKDATNNAEMAMREYTETLLFKIAAEGLDEDQALSLAYAMGLVDEKTVHATEKAKLYQKWLKDGSITIEEYNELILKLGDYLDSLPEDVEINVHAKFISDIPSWIMENADLTMGGGSGGGTSFNTRPLGGGVQEGVPVQWGEYNRPELFVPDSGGRVVNAQQIVEALRSAGVNLGGSNMPSIENLNVYTNDGTNAVMYGVDKYMGLAVAL